MATPLVLALIAALVVLIGTALSLRIAKQYEHGVLRRLVRVRTERNPRRRTQ